MKKFLSIILTLTLTCMLISINSSAAGFIDIEPSNWFYPTVVNMVNLGLINGYEDNTFRPTKSISRIEYAKIIFSALPKIRYNKQFI